MRHMRLKKRGEEGALHTLNTSTLQHLQQKTPLRGGNANYHHLQCSFFITVALHITVRCQNVWRPKNR